MALGAPCGVPQAWLPLRVASTPGARRLVRALGGTLYVTLGDDGRARIATAPPSEPVDADGADGGGFLVVYDRRLAWPDELRVSVDGGRLALEASGGSGLRGDVVWWTGTDRALVV